MVWAGSWLLRREKYSPHRCFSEGLETVDNQGGRRHLRREDTLTRNRSTQLRVAMTAQWRLFGRYAIAACTASGAMVLQLVPVGDRVCRFPPRLGQPNDGERDHANVELERINHTRVILTAAADGRKLRAILDSSDP